AEEGIPPFRPLVLEYPEDAETYDIDDQFFIGDRLMAAPLTAESDRRRVYIPDGQWRDYRTGERYSPGWLEKEFDLMEIPLFIR
ncbi:MAG: hypothetical protein LBH54_05615, partial [Clostridiales bacterium]|nr:hypothetical protein [Clostridiales bacterium]